MVRFQHEYKREVHFFVLIFCILADTFLLDWKKSKRSLTWTFCSVTTYWVSIFTITWFSVQWRSRIIARSCSFLYSFSTSYWAWSKYTPCSPVSIDCGEKTLIFLRSLRNLVKMWFFLKLSNQIFLTNFNKCSISTCLSRMLTKMWNILLHLILEFNLTTVLLDTF